MGWGCLGRDQCICGERAAVCDAAFGRRVRSHVATGEASWHLSAVAEAEWLRLPGGGEGVRAGTNLHTNDLLDALGMKTLKATKKAWLAPRLGGALRHLFREAKHVEALRRSGTITAVALLPEHGQYFEDTISVSFNEDFREMIKWVALLGDDRLRGQLRREG